MTVHRGRALFALTSGTRSTVADMRTQVQALFPDSVDQVMAIYAPNNYVDAVQSYWTNFARDGVPNGMSLKIWPTYDMTSDQSMTLVNPPDVAIGLEKTVCDFWDSYLAPHCCPLDVPSRMRGVER